MTFIDLGGQTLFNNVKIHMNFHQNQIINECAKKILAYYMTFNDL